MAATAKTAKTASAVQEKNPYVEQLVQLRKQCGYESAEAAAAAIGMNSFNYRAIEAGRNITMTTLQKVLDGFGKTLAEFAVVPVPTPPKKGRAR